MAESGNAAASRAVQLKLPFDKILSDFKEFCEIDLQLMDRTVNEHLKQVKKFLRALNKAPSSITVEDIRNYLSGYRERSPATYANVIKSLRRFFRDFKRMGVLVESFRFPEKPPFRPKIVPKKEELRSFYKALSTDRQRAMFLMLATTGLRRHELLEVKLRDIDFEKRMILPQSDGNRTKRTWVTFFNQEAEQALENFININDELTADSRIFQSARTIRKIFEKAIEKAGIHITPQVLREWFACEMGRLGVPDRYVDAFCGRVPKSVLARHYTDFSPERLKEIYDKANLKVLE